MQKFLFLHLPNKRMISAIRDTIRMADQGVQSLASCGGIFSRLHRQDQALVTVDPHRGWTALAPPHSGGSRIRERSAAMCCIEASVTLASMILLSPSFTFSFESPGQRPSVVMKDQHVFVHHRQTLRAILPTRRPMNMDGVHIVGISMHFTHTLGTWVEQSVHGEQTTIPPVLDEFVRSDRCWMLLSELCRPAAHCFPQLHPNSSPHTVIFTHSATFK